MMMLRSTASGMSRTDGKALTLMTLGRPGVDRVDHPGIAVREDVGKDRLADAAGPAGGADDRH